MTRRRSSEGGEAVGSWPHAVAPRGGGGGEPAVIALMFVVEDGQALNDEVFRKRGDGSMLWKPIPAVTFTMGNREVWGDSE